jgi:hypothetical protein
VTENDAISTKPAAARNGMPATPPISRNPASSGLTRGIVHTSIRRPPTRSAIAAPTSVPAAPEAEKATTAKPAP